MTYRSGDMVAPRIRAAEPLSLELKDFATAIATGRRPRSHAHFGLEIVRVLEAANTSLELRGQPVAIERAGEKSAVLNGNGPRNGDRNGSANGNGNGSERVVDVNASGNGGSGGNGHVDKRDGVELTVPASH